jgi:hypothetical protein
MMTINVMDKEQKAKPPYARDPALNEANNMRFGEEIRPKAYPKVQEKAPSKKEKDIVWKDSNLG